MRDVLAEWRPTIDETIEELLPRLIDEAYLEEFFGEPTYRYQSILFLIVVEALGAEPEEYLPYACIPEILHNGTIIVDDVEDEARMRRGETALHHRFGTDIALNAGNAMYFIPLKVIDRNAGKLDESQRLAAYEMLTHELNRTHLGQGMDICWHNQREITVDERRYYEMCACKTGCLASIVARLAAIVTDQPDAVEGQLARYAEEMSIAFQISDDILDIENTLDKAGARLEEILWAEENTDEEIMEAIDIMQSVEALDYARERAEELAASARGHLDDLDLEPDAEQNLRNFTRFVIERRT
ncbi:polyprenyl synthetase [Halobacteriales archaeon QH_2_65_14]|nr:MAG: polyprenyl synthetase [Halobacteriales archaeon QH_2_65_14]